MAGIAVLMPSLTTFVNSDGTILLTRKFHDGVVAKLEHWDGPIRVLIEADAEPSNNLDNFAVEPRSLPYEIEIVDFRSDALAEKIRGASIVVGTIGWQQSHLSRLCRNLGIASVYCTEYTLKTRLQIAHAEEERPLGRARRYAFEMNQERRNQLAIRLATGVHCNGTPTFDVYRWINRSPLLFFDNRIRASALIEEDALERRLATLTQKRPLRLAFSGRLDPMKGADHLPGIAQELRTLGVDFRLAICGDGRLSEVIAADIRRLGLERQVEMKGVLRFEEELVPYLEQEVDLFLSPHVQGDPSCTYLETFGCGVPIAGFDNEALVGFLRRDGVGWATPMRDHRALAEVIAKLDQDRDLLKRASRSARAFAAEHTFEQMIARRVEHMHECAASVGRTFSLMQFMSGQLARITGPNA